MSHPTSITSAESATDRNINYSTADVGTQQRRTNMYVFVFLNDGVEFAFSIAFNKTIILLWPPETFNCHEKGVNKSLTFSFTLIT